MNETLRDNLWELFPDLIFYDNPVQDESIIGLALLCDEGHSWVTVYDEDHALHLLSQEFIDSEDPITDAVEYFDFNVIGGYIGPSTPLFMHNDYESEIVASRCSQSFEKYITLKDVNSLSDAFDIVQKKNVFLFVPIDDLQNIKDYL